MKMYGYEKGKGGLHTKKKGKGNRLSVGAKGNARSLAQRGKKIILGSNNKGKTGRMDMM